MKISQILGTRIPLRSLLFGALLLGVTAWSPPSDNKVIVGDVTDIGGMYLLVAGSSNTSTAYNSLLIGKSNVVEGPDGNGAAYHSAAIGYQNHVLATRGWALGWGNEASADKGVAIGTGTQCESEMGVALGRFNDGMTAGDVLAVGNGADGTSRSTALRVTGDTVVLGALGTKVVLANSQGDISMGSYGN